MKKTLRIFIQNVNYISPNEKKNFILIKFTNTREIERIKNKKIPDQTGENQTISIVYPMTGEKKYL